MRLLARAGPGLLAAGLNAAILLGPRLIVSNHIRPGQWLALACLCSAVGLEAAVAPRAAPPGVDDLVWLNWAQGLAFLAAFELAFLLAGSASQMSLLAGCALILAGAVLRCLAIRRLGAGFTNTSRPATADICVDGVYRWLRHPAETGLLLIGIGFPLALHAWTVMAFTLPVLLALALVRVRLEERGLARAFPNRFDAYRRRVRL